MTPISGNTDTIDERNVVIQPLSKFWFQSKVAGVDVLRLDLLHPVVSGNKWYKLRLNLAYAVDNGFKTVVTFGGGYSNHLVATAYAAQMFGLHAVGVVRGVYAEPTPTLNDCRRYGMELHFVTKDFYGNKGDAELLRELTADFESTYIVPEGGANERGRTGAGLIDRFVSKKYTHIALAVGTGTTLAGLRNKLPVQQKILGFAPFKNAGSMAADINHHIAPEKRQTWQLFDKWHFGGFGKRTPELVDFMNGFYRETRIPLDIVYTSKMMFGIHDMLEACEFNSSDKILCIHSGGLQGNSSVKGQLVY